VTSPANTAGEFTYSDIVRVKDDASDPLRRGHKAWVVLVVRPQDRSGTYFDRFPPGVVYSVEYEDGVAEDAHEDSLERFQGT
jgi:hypothetical protein